jgi:copper(I)-binding protein
MKMRKLLLASVALSIASLGLAACGSEPAEQPEAAPEGIPGVTVTNARLVLPAVKGNPGVVYLELAYGDPGTSDRVALSGAHVAGAKSATLHEYSEWNRQKVMAEMVRPVIAKGETLKFEPGGKHIMANELDETLAAGGNTEVTLTFAGGDKISVPAAIKAAGDDR